MPFSIAGRTFSETRLTLSCAKSAKSDILVSWDACCFSEWAAVQNWETYTSHSQVNLWILSESQKEVLSHINTVLNCSVFICYQIYAFGMLKTIFSTQRWEVFTFLECFINHDHQACVEMDLLFSFGITLEHHQVLIKGPFTYYVSRRRGEGG